MKTFWTWWDKQASWWGSHSLVWWVGYLTAVYVGLVILVVAARLNELLALPLNSLGDFSAGAFGPIAFLWLILGYKQQGDELKASSAALEAQVSELRNSMELQRSNAEKQDLILDPVFNLSYKGMLVEHGESMETLGVLNSGPTCKELKFKFESQMNKEKIFMGVHAPILQTGAQVDFTVMGAASEAMVDITISYIRINGSKGNQTITLIKLPGREPIIMRIPKPEL